MPGEQEKTVSALLGQFNRTYVLDAGSRRLAEMRNKTERFPASPVTFADIYNDLSTHIFGLREYPSEIQRQVIRSLMKNILEYVELGAITLTPKPEGPDRVAMNFAEYASLRLRALQQQNDTALNEKIAHLDKLRVVYNGDNNTGAWVLNTAPK